MVEVLVDLLKLQAMPSLCRGPPVKIRGKMKVAEVEVRI